MTIDRKAAIAAYKERDADAGVFAFRCTSSGQVWVGPTPTLSTIENRIRFTLRTGGNRTKGLPEAWAAAAGEGFTFEVLERIDPELSAMHRDVELKARTAVWRAKLGAAAI
ncbi:MAG: GIY-YIG nuclease family protein, partial [Paracoccaceae bacterium]|nr:GIY-YIG nuclease family protein [Paracoccaceae bacterium]